MVTTQNEHGVREKKRNKKKKKEKEKERERNKHEFQCIPIDNITWQLNVAKL